MIALNLFAVLDKFEQTLSSKDTETKAQLYKKLNIDLMQQFSFLDINAQSFASGLIDLETSQFLYNKLRAYDSTTLAERIVINELMMELIQKRRASRNW